MQGLPPAAKSLLYDISKRDDDARLVIDPNDGGLYVETSEWNEEARPAAPAEPPLLVQAATAPTIDVRVQVVTNLFLAHSCVALICVVVGAVIFYWNLSRNQSLVLLAVDLALFLCFYLTMLLIRKAGIYALIPFSLWVICLSVLVGVVSLLVHNQTPIQLAAIIWGQCIAMVIYAKKSPSALSLGYSAAYMGLATLVVWGASIAAFVVQRDWLAGAVILVLSGGCIGYHVYQVHLCGERGYNLGWEDGVLGLVQFYWVW